MREWGLLIVVYLYLAGMAGGIYFTMSMYELFTGSTRSSFKKGYVFSLVLLLIAVFCLVIDLERPARFIHMMIAFKFFSPMSVGSWGLLFFGLNTFVTICMNSEGPLKPLGDLFSRILPYKAVILIGSALSVFLTAYTGVLLSETTVTLWMATPFLGALFLASGISCGACVLTLIDHGNSGFKTMGKKFDNMCLLVELTVVFLFFLALTIGYGPFPEAKRLFDGLYGFLFIGMGVVVGAVIPIIINMTGSTGKLSPLLVLIGAFCLRYAIVFAGQ